MPVVTPKCLALACHQLRGVLATVDIETVDALARVCDPAATITREVAEALAVGLLLELRARRPGKR
jgi:hypothetical protein